MRRLEPRQINELSGVAGFIRSWDAVSAAEASANLAKVDRSRFGNINIGGQPKTATSHLVSKSRENFYEFIEPGVQDWVAFFVEAMGMTTYTSCEGHQYETAVQDADERHVGIILRSNAQRSQIIDLHTQVSESLSNPFCEIAYMDHLAFQDKYKISVIDIYISKKPNAGWTDYFENLDHFNREVICLSKDALAS